MTLILSPNICLLFFRDPEMTFTPERLKQVLGSGLTETGGDPPFAFRCGGGPILYLAITRGEFVESFGRRLMGRGRKYRPLLSGCDTQIEITFRNLDEALDEISTLIDVQQLLQSATDGLLYRSWNQTFSGPED
jgi:hypothetical protein